MKLDIKLPDKAVIVIIIAGVLVIASIPVLIGPKIGKIKAAALERQKVREEVAAVRTKVDYLMSINAEQLKQETDLVARALLKEKNAFSMVGIIRKIADANGFGVSSFSVSLGQLKSSNAKEKKKESSWYAKIPIGITLNGPADRYLDLTTGLENSLPIMEIEKLDMKADGSALVEIKLAISSFYIEQSMTPKLETASLAELMLGQSESATLSRLGGF